MAVTTAVMAAIVILGTSIAAEAHWLSTGWQWKYRASDGTICAKYYNEISHNETKKGGTVQGAAESWGLLNVAGYDQYCQWPTKRKFSMRNRLWKYTSSGNALCYDSDWVVSTEANQKAQLFSEWTNPPCGAGWYTSDGAGYVYNSNDDKFYGGWLSVFWESGPNFEDKYHQLPEGGATIPVPGGLQNYVVRV